MKVNPFPQIICSGTENPRKLTFAGIFGGCPDGLEPSTFRTTI